MTKTLPAIIAALIALALAACEGDRSSCPHPADTNCDGRVDPRVDGYVCEDCEAGCVPTVADRWNAVCVLDGESLPYEMLVGFRCSDVERGDRFYCDDGVLRCVDADGADVGVARCLTIVDYGAN